MKSSIQRKLTLLYAFAIGLIVVTGFVSFYYLYKLGTDIGGQITRDIELIQNLERIHDSVIHIHGIGNEIIYSANDTKMRPELEKKISELTVLLSQNSEHSIKSENKVRYNTLIDSMAVYQAAILSANIPGSKTKARNTMRTIRNEANTLINDKNAELELHKQRIHKQLSNSQRNLILILMLVIGGGTLIAIVMPHRIALPFRKFIYALREVENGNLNVRLPEKGEGEVVEMQSTFNDTVKHLSVIEEMRIRKINFERRRFGVLGDMVDYAILLVSVEGKIIHLNGQFYEVFNLTSDDVLGRSYEDSPFSQTIKDLITSVIAKSEKCQNHDFKVEVKRKDGTVLERTMLVDASPVKNHAGAIVNWVITLEDKDYNSKTRLFSKV
jgi:PAS domain S-box-containing protein